MTVHRSSTIGFFKKMESLSKPILNFNTSATETEGVSFSLCQPQHSDHAADGTGGTHGSRFTTEHRFRLITLFVPVDTAPACQKNDPQAGTYAAVFS